MAKRFQVDGRLVAVEALGNGNVNDTYLVIFRTVFSEERFILQRISGNVFKDPIAVTENIRFVTNFVHQRLIEEQDRAERIWQLPKLIPAKDGKPYAIDGDGNCWRAITIIASASSYASIQSPDHAFEVGAVLGQFHRIFADLPVDQLRNTLPGFHITPNYLAQLDEALKSPDGQARLESSAVAKNALTFINKRRAATSILEDAKAAGKLTLRAIHGDPKTANIMIDDTTGKGTSIIDLDTVGPGLVHYDIGDCLRSCCNPAGEEAGELSQVTFNMDLCKAVMDGYKCFSQNSLTKTDCEYFYDAIHTITLELAIRFFADYIAGDVYFRIRHEGQNLHRARVQIKLCQSIEANEAQLRRLAEKL